MQSQGVPAGCWVRAAEVASLTRAAIWCASKKPDTCFSR